MNQSRIFYGSLGFTILLYRRIINPNKSKIVLIKNLVLFLTFSRILAFEIGYNCINTRRKISVN
jgi:hypothetical protein